MKDEELKDFVSEIVTKAADTMATRLEDRTQTNLGDALNKLTNQLTKVATQLDDYIKRTGDQENRLRKVEEIISTRTGILGVVSFLLTAGLTLLAAYVGTR